MQRSLKAPCTNLLLTLCLSAAATLSCAKDKASPSPDAEKKELIQSALAKKEPTALDYVKHKEAYNPEAPIPSQCYTETKGVHNPCYVCHQTYREPKRPNMMHDGFQQGSYAFSEEGETNSWTNLFKDRRAAIAKVSDAEILRYVRKDNYTALMARLKEDDWTGVVPEIAGYEKGAAAFDEYGLARDGSRWVAFNYKPFPSTFWPTNGSTDDTMIRLPEAFSSAKGKFSRDVYYANLSLVEMAITDVDKLSTPPLNEKEIGTDLDGDGLLKSEATEMKRRENYLGDASETALAHMLYPEGTEFLHGVRYIDIDEKGGIAPAVRLKELRYMRKNKFKSQLVLKNDYYKENKEKHFGKLPLAVDQRDNGVSNSFGWFLLGFIENEKGELRKQHAEEQHFCVGCHKSIGSTIDQTFGFPRKVAGRAGWRYIDLRKMQDAPNRGESEGEYLTYMKRVGGGDEFRQNDEMLTRWFKKDGRLNEEKVRDAKNLYDLITPSQDRALALDKAYREIVKEQSFLFGRDTSISPATNVIEKVNMKEAPLLAEHRYEWDIRLDWSK